MLRALDAGASRGHHPNVTLARKSHRSITGNTASTRTAIASWQRAVPIAALAALAAAALAPVSIAARVLLVVAYLGLPLFATVRRGVPIAERGGLRILTQEASWLRTDTITRFVAAFAWVAATPGLLGHSFGIDDGGPPVLAFFIALTLSMVTLVGLLRRMTLKPERMPSVLVETEGVTLFGEKPDVVRFDDLVDVQHDASSITLVTAAHGAVGMVVENVHVAGGAHAAIVDAWQAWEKSARGAKSSLESLLARPRGASARAWLGNLDSLSLAGEAGAAYRGGGVDEEELWSTLGQSDASPDARAAAARLLARDDESRVRVADLVRVVSDDATRARIEATLKPTEEAAAELEAMEAEAMEREVGC